MSTLRLTVTHWLPIVTFCPVNNLPDLIYVELTFEEFVELYEVRRKLRKELSWKTMFMESIADKVKDLYPEAKVVTVRLMFNKHVVRIQ